MYVNIVFAPTPGKLFFSRFSASSILYKHKYSALPGTNQQPARRKNLYEVLEVDPGASQSEIKDSFIKLSKIYHPDVISGSGNDEKKTKKFLEIREAYNILKDEEARAYHDEALEARRYTIAKSLSYTAFYPPRKPSADKEQTDQKTEESETKNTLNERVTANQARQVPRAMAGRIVDMHRGTRFYDPKTAYEEEMKFKRNLKLAGVGTIIFFIGYFTLLHFIYKK